MIPGAAWWARHSIIAAIALGYPTLAPAQDPPTEPTRVAPGARTRVWIMAAWDERCQALPSPRIEITVPPAKGTVSLREGQATTVRTSRAGTCLGTRVTGTGVYYSAKPNASGADTFTIDARLPTGETTSRTFRLEVSSD